MTLKDKNQALYRFLKFNFCIQCKFWKKGFILGAFLMKNSRQVQMKMDSNRQLVLTAIVPAVLNV